MNHFKKLKSLLESIYTNGKPGCSFEIIIVDNCSKDETISYIMENYPEVKLKINDKPKGFAENNNIGFNLSIGEFVFICNPDVVVFPKAIDILIDYLETNKDVGIICPKLLNTDLTYQPSVRRFINLKIILMRMITRSNDSSNSKVVMSYLMSDFNNNLIQSVDWAMGAALLMKRELYESLKGFDENYYLYVEDVDLCLRCWKMGKKVVYNPLAVMVHDHQRESARSISIKTWWHLKSIIYYLFKHGVLFRKRNFNLSDK